MPASRSCRPPGSASSTPASRSLGPRWPVPSTSSPASSAASAPGARARPTASGPRPSCCPTSSSCGGACPAPTAATPPASPAGSSAALGDKATRPVLAAALLHDVGKLDAHLRTYGRVVATLAGGVVGHDEATIRHWTLTTGLHPPGRPLPAAPGARRRPAGRRRERPADGGVGPRAPPAARAVDDRSGSSPRPSTRPTTTDPAPGRVTTGIGGVAPIAQGAGLPSSVSRLSPASGRAPLSS